MSKKEKSVNALVEDLQAMIALVPRLEAVIKAHKEITAGYQKYRKNGGEAIPGIEKHVGLTEKPAAPSVKKKKTESKTKTAGELSETGAEEKKAKKKKSK